jgi:hypothetical protein
VAKRNLEQLLKASAKNWAQRYTILARAKAPRHIAPHISTSSSVTAGQVTLTSSIKVIDARGAEGTISNYGTMDARAQEYGHPGATITPRTGRYLAFHWQIHPQNAKYDKEGRILLTKVTKLPQPAFNNGQGYMRPAMDEWTQEILASSARFKDAIKLDISEAFKGLGK